MEAQKASLLGYAGEADQYWSHTWRDLGAGRGLQKLKGTEDLKGTRKVLLVKKRQEGRNGVGTLEMEEQDAMLTKE